MLQPLLTIYLEFQVMSPILAMNMTSVLSGSLLTCFVSAAFLLVVIVRIGFALAVYQDGLRLKKKDVKGRSTVLATPGIWGLATLLGGLPVAVTYWVLHHFSLLDKFRIEGEENRAS